MTLSNLERDQGSEEFFLHSLTSQKQTGRGLSANIYFFILYLNLAQLLRADYEVHQGINSLADLVDKQSALAF